jgi:hypothetical protein
MNRLLELADKKDRTELEELEYNYLDKLQNLNGLIALAKSMGNKNYQNNFMIKDAMEQYIKARDIYEKAIKGV